MSGHAGDLVSLHRQDDNIVHAGLGDLVGCRDRARVPLGAILQDQFQPATLCRLQVGPTADECHLLSGEGKLDSDHPPDRARPNDTDLHKVLPDNKGGVVSRTSPAILALATAPCDAP